MSNLYLIAEILVLAIGLWLAVKYYGQGMKNPTFLTGIAFILIALPSVLSMLMY